MLRLGLPSRTLDPRGRSNLRLQQNKTPPSLHVQIFRSKSMLNIESVLSHLLDQIWYPPLDPPLDYPGFTPGPTHGPTPGSAPGPTPGPTPGSAPGPTPGPIPGPTPGSTPGSWSLDPRSICESFQPVGLVTYAHGPRHVPSRRYTRFLLMHVAADYWSLGARAAAVSEGVAGGGLHRVTGTSSRRGE